jgi:hypothetical protein
MKLRQSELRQSASLTASRCHPFGQISLTPDILHRASAPGSRCRFDNLLNLKFLQKVAGILFYCTAEANEMT